MKYIKYTYVDAATGVSVASHPAANGPVFPAVAGLAFAWARESQYPTDVPEFFGTCPDDADTQVDGVLGVYLQSEWNQMQSDEMAARNPAPASCTRRQGRLALLQVGRLDLAEAPSMPYPTPPSVALRRSSTRPTPGSAPTRFWSPCGLAWAAPSLSWTTCSGSPRQSDGQMGLQAPGEHPRQPRLPAASRAAAAHYISAGHTDAAFAAS